MYTEWPYPLSSNHDALTPRTAAYCWLQCRLIPSLADVAPSIRQQVGLQLAGMLLTQLSKCCLKWVNQHSTSSWRCLNVGKSMVSKRPRAHLPPLMVINLINCRPGKKTTLTHCSVCLSHQGIFGQTTELEVYGQTSPAPSVYRWFTLMGGLYIQQAQYVLPMSN